MAPTLRLAPDAPPPAADGRRRRSQDSRARIVTALLELVAEGSVSPGAEAVAARAGVGLRTVFRHFSDMDGLYREMAAHVEQAFLQGLSQPLAATDWRERVLEMLHRRITVYEKIAPFRRAGDAHRHRSAFITGNQARFAAVTREMLDRHLPAEARRDPQLIEALDLLLSFEAWNRLRQEQRLSTRRAAELLEALVRRQLG